MYNKILVALDIHQPTVFETALSMAQATGADLLLLHVLSYSDVDSPATPIAIAWD
ncbi:MAG: universal stress protein, partial [Phormidesmis sp. RL_2_1]|nr:universal stress protein [Phormidesmis sp. RL_2_1]